MKGLSLINLLLILGSSAFGQGEKKVILVIDNILQKPLLCNLISHKNNKDTPLGKTDTKGYITLTCEDIDSIKAVPDDNYRYYSSKYYNCVNLNGKIIISNKYQCAVLNKKIDSLTLKDDYLTAAIYYNILDDSYRLVDSNSTADIYKQLSYQAVAKHLKLDKAIQYEANSTSANMSDKLKVTLLALQRRNGLSAKTDEMGNLLLDKKTLEILVGREKYKEAIRTATF
jgi:hypothetical protein